MKLKINNQQDVAGSHSLLNEESNNKNFKGSTKTDLANSKLKDVKLESLEIHPFAKEFTFPDRSKLLKFSMRNHGQLNPILVVERDGQLFIIDGIRRFEVARLFPSEFPSITCQIVQITDKEIKDHRIKVNGHSKRGIIEICRNVDHILGVLGKQQGVKREILDLNNIESEFKPNIKMDRFHWACIIANIEFKASTLKKLMYVYYAEENQAEKDKTNILELLDKGQISVHKAYQLTKSKEAKEEEMVKKQEIIKFYQEHRNNPENDLYKLYAKSSLKMDEVPDNSVRLCLCSPPYFQQRSYRNQGENPLGQEATSKEYIDRIMEYNMEVKKKLLSNGVLVIVIAESYLGGYQGIIPELIVRMRRSGFRILDENVWIKTNPKYAKHFGRFMNAKESIIVACNSDEDPVFNNIKTESATGKFKVNRGSKRSDGTTNYYMAAPESDRTNVFTTPVSNPRDLKAIDPTFQHDAPCRVDIYQDFIEAYSNAGDVIIDNFVGSGTIAIGLTMGRKVIGYDIDPESIAFCEKRFNKYLGEQNSELKDAA
ncbi:ParB N-terminal domain-containing protein [bacterium]|nr:ParB N-terminal domain-containing protein [bacterium]